MGAGRGPARRQPSDGGGDGGGDKLHESWQDWRLAVSRSQPRTEAQAAIHVDRQDRQDSRFDRSASG